MTNKVNWTTQRRAIYEIVADTTDHPTANDIIERLRERGHHFAYGTIYNSLRYLVAAGLLRELKLGDATSRYDARTEEHLHIICDNCGNVTEVAMDLPAIWLSAVTELTGYQLHQPEVLLHGICPTCQANTQRGQS